MEDPEIEYEVLAETIDAVERASWLSGGRRASFAGLERLLEPGRDSLSILDVGTGNGGLARAFADWGTARDLQVDVLGIDLLENAIEAASRDHGDVDGERTFDIVHASLVLHHFPGESARRALDTMAAHANLGVVVNDLHRHPVHWVASKAFLPLVTRNAIAIHDGPVSVLRGFKRRELLELGRRSRLTEASVEWRFPFRWLLIGRP